MFVLDASVAASWIFPDEGGVYADLTLERLLDGAAVVPGIWPLEMANLLLVAERRGRLSRAQTVQALDYLSDLPIQIMTVGSIGELVDLGRQSNLSAYDSSYLLLARHERLPLATWDVRLRGAAVDAGVRLLDVERSDSPE